MKPLFFLSIRYFWNNLRLTFSTPKRAIPMIALILIVGFLLYNHSVGSSGIFTQEIGDPQLYITTSINCFLIVYFVVGLLISLGGKFVFKPADSDTLMATSLSPRAILTHSILKNSFTNWFRWLLIAIVVPKSNFTLVKLMTQEYGSFQTTLALATLFVGLFFVNIIFSSLGILYQLNLCAYQHSPKEERKHFFFICGVFIGLFSILLFSAFQFKNALMTGFSHTLSGLLAKPFFGTLHFDLSQFSMGVMIYIPVLIICLALARKRACWLYELATERGVQVAKSTSAKSFNYIDRAAKKAQLHSSIEAKETFIQRMRLKGGTSILWKDLIVIWRSSGRMILLLFFAAIFVSFLPTQLGVYLAQLITKRKCTLKEIQMVCTSLVPALHYIIAILITSVAAKTGAFEFLKRADLQKPIPIKPIGTAFYEILGKAIPSVITTVIASTIFLSLFPDSWRLSIWMFLILVCAAFLTSVSVILATLLFPTCETAGDNLLRGIATFASNYLIIPVGICIVSYIIPPSYSVEVVAAILGGLFITYLCVLLLFIGRLYAAYQPAD